MLERFRYIDISRIRRCHPIDISKYLLLDKSKTAYALFLIGILMNFYASIHVMYFWPFETYISVFTLPIFMAAVFLSKQSSRDFFTRSNFILPILLVILTQCYQVITNAAAFTLFCLAILSGAMYFTIFRLDKKLLPKLTTTICKVTASFLVVSISYFVLYILGFNLPSNSTEHATYYYTNYYLFLLDDRALWSIILPRFHSVCLEPGHLGTMLVMLLATQIGQWKKWYNIVLFVALFLTFSLAAYCLLVILFFLRLWILRQKILVKILVLVLTISSIVGGSFIYNDGDNMLNQLIVMRLEMNDDGDDFEGNNRVSNDFSKEFERFIITEEAIFGKEYVQEAWGLNSGYRVYIYDYGLVGFALFMLFYLFSFRSGRDKRCIIAAFILALVNFWIRGYPLLTAFYLPYFLLSQLEVNPKIAQKETK